MEFAASPELSVGFARLNTRNDRRNRETQDLPGRDTRRGRI